MGAVKDRKVFPRRIVMAACMAAVDSHKNIDDVEHRALNDEAYKVYAVAAVARVPIPVPAWLEEWIPEGSDAVEPKAGRPRGS